MNLSPGKPKFLSSINNQWKKRKMRNVPPNIRRIGEDCSIALCTFGSLLNADKSAPTGPSCGETAQTIAQGSKPRIRKTAINSPQTKNHLLAFGFIVDKTS